ncbi:type II toxin-antitoxin system death-on-curing family toxin [Nocardioides sp. YR527]|uniref:type II toxin-antitoxin system death-on-curing family toxin n=1 Tax=Nocardioides sp. YR527 TaxID=1881028 RepID=UPI000ABA9814|nr:type II toxin-antitoxin system death-on-curing family toxin [Nocardioides sp. YR527]
MAKSLTVESLAKEMGIDTDVALVTLWDVGIEQIEDIDQPIPTVLHKQVRRALGGATPREMQQLAYWMNLWDSDRETVVRRVKEQFGVTVSAGARTLPTGALKRMRAAEQQHRPLTAPLAATPAPIAISQIAEPFELQLPGRNRVTEMLGVDEILSVHHALVSAFEESGDPIDPPGVRDENLLCSAVMRPNTGIGDVAKYDTVEGHAAALLHSLVHNHPFHNGNKRTALVSMLVLLDRNGILLTCDQQALFKHVLFVAQHKLVSHGASDYADREVQAIADWIWEHSRQIQHGDRLLTWRELRRILTKFDCTISNPMPGNKVRIERRSSERRSVFGRRREATLRFVAGYRNEGSDVGRAQLAAIRKELKLAEKDGYDSEHFYGNDRREPDSFIAEHRLLLRRLGRL